MYTNPTPMLQVYCAFISTAYCFDANLSFVTGLCFAQDTITIPATFPATSASHAHKLMEYSRKRTRLSSGSEEPSAGPGCVAVISSSSTSTPTPQPLTKRSKGITGSSRTRSVLQPEAQSQTCTSTASLVSEYDRYNCFILCFIGL